MILEENIKNVKFVLSKDEIGYNEVLNDFDNSNEIFILTFNISANGDNLISRLKELDSEIRVHIVTNIPQRYGSYYGDSARNRARQNIKIYLNKLSPKTFEAQIMPFFNFNNHAKIITTDNIAYIGSANFSDESLNNFESGIIVKDRNFIQFLKKEVFPELIAFSEPYFEDEYMELKIFVPSIFSRLSNLRNKFENEFFDYDDRDEKFYRIDMDFNIDAIELENLEIGLYELEDIIEIINDKSLKLPEMRELQNFVDKSKIQTIFKLIEVNNNIFNACNFNYQEFCDNYLEEHSMEAYDEHLDQYVKLADEEAHEVFEELARRSEDDIKEFTILFDELIKEISNLNKELHKVSVNEKIDNT
jgi:hypothetical protein